MLAIRGAENGHFIVECCHCRKIKQEGDWIHGMPLPADVISHGICPACFDIHWLPMIYSSAKAVSNTSEVPVTPVPMVLPVGHRSLNHQQGDAA